MACKEERTILQAVQEHGAASLKRTKKGYLVMGPFGTTVIHPAGSAGRLSFSLRQLVCSLKRVGALPKDWRLKG